MRYVVVATRLEPAGHEYVLDPWPARVIVSLGDPVVLVTFTLLFLDTFFRVSILFDDEYPPFGVGEWLFRPKLAAGVLKGWAALRDRLRGPRE